jgi:hypothetical protein
MHGAVMRDSCDAAGICRAVFGGLANRDDDVGRAGKPIQIVAPENFHGDVVRQTGTNPAAVTSIPTNPDQDPSQ